MSGPSTLPANDGSRHKAPDLEPDETPVVSDLLERLRARVEERRASGAYPPGLEHDLVVHSGHNRGAPGPCATSTR